jgi:zinc protease
VYNKYIKNKPAVILSVYPKGKPELIAHADNFVVIKPARPADLGKETDKLVYNKTKDTFDRSKKPAAAYNPVIKVPAYWETKFGNGLKVIGMKNDELPVVTLQLSIEAGHMMEAKDMSKAGIATLVAGMMDEATEKHTAEELSQELDKLGSSVDVNADKNYITITISTLLKNLDKTLAIAEEKLMHPKFSAEDFDRLKNEQLQIIANQVTQPVVIANNAYSKLLYGKDNIMGIPNSGTAETVKSITLDDVKNYYKTNLSPSISDLVIVGDITKEAVEPKLAFLKNWAAKPVTLPVIAAAPKVEKTKIYLIDKEKAPQSEIRIGYVALPYDATGDYYKAGLMNYVLGGAFNSHINLNLREDKGWTYGARSGFQGDKVAGAFTASAGVKGIATDSSVVEFIKELKNYSNKGITEDELTFTKSSIGQSDALRYETGVQKASFLKRIATYNLDKGFVDKQNEILKNMTKAEIDAIAKKDLDMSKMIIVVVGDAKTTKEGLSKLGYEIVELDKEGNTKTND